MKLPRKILASLFLSKHAVHYSSKSKEEETPQWLYNHFNSLFYFDLDACASIQNHKCRNYFTKKDNALTKPWRKYSNGPIWCNPPYGRNIDLWLIKGYNASKYVQVVFLLPARPDTQWWHDWVTKASEIIFLKGRLKFNETTAKHVAPFPSVIAIFNPSNYGSGRDPITSYEDLRPKMKTRRARTIRQLWTQ